MISIGIRVIIFQINVNWNQLLWLKIQISKRGVYFIPENIVPNVLE